MIPQTDDQKSSQESQKKDFFQEGRIIVSRKHFQVQQVQEILKVIYEDEMSPQWLLVMNKRMIQRTFVIDLHLISQECFNSIKNYIFSNDKSFFITQKNNKGQNTIFTFPKIVKKLEISAEEKKKQYLEEKKKQEEQKKEAKNEEAKEEAKKKKQKKKKENKEEEGKKKIEEKNNEAFDFNCAPKKESFNDKQIDNLSTEFIKRFFISFKNQENLLKKGKINAYLAETTEKIPREELLISQEDKKIYGFQNFEKKTQKNEKIEKKEGGKLPKMFALDCEMVETEKGLELARATLLDEEGKVLMDTLCKPTNKILNYNTKWSGITEETLANVTASLEDVQKTFFQLIHEDDILIGQSLENDLKAMQISHENIIDTCIMYPHPKGFPYRNSLKFLAKKFLMRDIQQNTHDSFEDALAALDLVRLKLRKPSDYQHKRPNFFQILAAKNKEITKKEMSCLIMDNIGVLKELQKKSDLNLEESQNSETIENKLGDLLEKEEKMKMTDDPNEESIKLIEVKDDEQTFNKLSELIQKKTTDPCLVWASFHGVSESLKKVWKVEEKKEKKGQNEKDIDLSQILKPSENDPNVLKLVVPPLPPSPPQEIYIPDETEKFLSDEAIKVFDYIRELFSLAPSNTFFIFLSPFGFQRTERNDFDPKNGFTTFQVKN